MTVRRAAPALWVLAAALLVQGLLLLQYRHDPFLATPVSDALSYDGWARRILARGLAAEPVFHQPPLFPVLLAGAYALGGSRGPELALAGQALVAALAVAALVPLGRRYLDSAAAGAAAAVLALLHAPFAFHALKPLPVTLALATQALALLALAAARERGTRPAAAAAGAALGLAALARAEILLFAPLALVALGQAPGRREGRLPGGASRLALFLAGLAVAVAPATLHNLVRGDLVAVASAGGENLFIGNQRGADGGHTPLHPQAGDILSQRELARLVAERERGRPLRPSEVSAYWRDRALAEIAADPRGWLALLGRKLGRLFDPGDPTDLYSVALETERHLPALRLLVVPPWGVLALAIPGLWIALRRGARRAWPLAALCALHVAVGLLFFVSTRLRLPLYFLLCPFAGLALVEGWRRLRSGARGPGRVALPALAGIAILAAGVASAVVHSRVPARERVRLASVLSQQGRFDEALDVLAPAVEGARPDAVALDQAGWVLQQQQRYGEAAERYAAAVARGLPEGREHQTLTRLAMVLERLGRTDEAAARHDAAVAAPGADAGTWYERGTFLLRRGRKAEARADLERAAALDPAWPAPREQLRRLAAGVSAQVEQGAR